MSEQITSKLDNASTNATTCVGSTPAIYKLYESNGITICGGLSYCPYKDKMEKDIRAKVQKEVRDEMFSEHPQPRYGGAFYSLDENGKTTLIYLKKVIYNAPATIAFWSDDTKTVCKCDPRDRYDPEKGLLLCQMKKMYGGELVHKLLEDWSIPYSYSIVTLADVRRKHR